MMESAESTITSKFQLTLPRMVRETLGVSEKDHVIFLVEDKSVKMIKKPGDILKAMDEFSEGAQVSAKDIRDEIRKERRKW